MKKNHLDFQKKVISTLSGNELAKFQGGNTAFSYNGCATVDKQCTASRECTDQDSWQNKCLSDIYNTQKCETNLCEFPVGPEDPGTCGCVTYDNCKSLFIACEAL